MAILFGVGSWLGVPPLEINSVGLTCLGTSLDGGIGDIPPRVIIQLDDCDRKREAGIPLEVLYVLIEYV